MKNSATNETNEPFAEEAKQFIETRLLQRQVKVQLDGVNNQNLVGTVITSQWKYCSVFIKRRSSEMCRLEFNFITTRIGEKNIVRQKNMQRIID